MKPAGNINNLFENSKITVGGEVDKKILNEAMSALPHQATQPDTNIWSIIMHSKITKTAIAAGLILMIYWLTLSDKGVPQAYAIDQTLEAMNTINSVHFKAEVYKQGNIECWMLFDKSNPKPTHVCLFMPDFPIRKIDSPRGSFGYNAATNRYRLNRRDERKQSWYPDFANFFKQSLQKAKDSDAVIITEAYNDKLKQEVIVITVDEGDRKCEYLIDPKTKLPIRFNMLSTANFMKYYQKTLAIKNMSFIEYNKPAPEGLFDVPKDAQKVTNEHDILVHPNTGMPVGTLTPQQACEKIVRETAKAMNERDWEKAKKLLFPFGAPPKVILDVINANPKVPLVEILELGQPYEKDGYWYIPSKSKELGVKIKDEIVPVKFYEFDSKKFCKIMWPD